MNARDFFKLTAMAINAKKEYVHQRTPEAKAEYEKYDEALIEEIVRASYADQEMRQFIQDYCPFFDVRVRALEMKEYVNKKF